MSADTLDQMIRPAASSQAVPAARRLAEYAAGLRFEGLPAIVVDALLDDRRVTALAKRIRVVERTEGKGWHVRLTLTLNNGETLRGESGSLLGCPDTPFSPDQLRAKFDRLVRDDGPAVRERLFDNLMRLEELSSVRDLPLT